MGVKIGFVWQNSIFVFGYSSLKADGSGNGTFPSIVWNSDQAELFIDSGKSFFIIKLPVSVVL